MLAAARVGDAIGHSHALAGLTGGTILGGLISAAGSILGGMLFAAGCASACFGVGVLLIGASVAVGMLAGALGEKARDACVAAGASSLTPAGVIKTGSHNVFINGKPCAVATFSAVSCDRDRIQQVAQGSSSVFINNLPAARQSDKTTCAAAIMEGSPNVCIGGMAMPANITASELPSWAYTVSDLTMFAAGLISFGGSVGKGPGALQKLFAKLPGAARISRTLCMLGPLAVAIPVIGILAKPVDVISGQKFLQDDDELDFSLEGELPLIWQRSYLSSHASEGVLGRGWSLFWESELRQVEEGIAWRNTLGDIIPFPAVPAGHRTFCPDQQCWLAHEEDGSWCISNAGELRYRYPAFDEKGRSPLSVISDNFGNRLTFHYNEQRQMETVSRNDKPLLRCEYHREHPRLTAVWQQIEGGEAQRARYDYDEDGFLVAVRHRGEAVMRRFGWDKQTALMSWHENAAGLRCDYQWRQVDDIWRVIEWRSSEGDGWRLAYDEASRTVTWQDGSQAEWKLDEQRRVSCYSDRLGNEHHLMWDTNGNLAGYRSPMGHLRQCCWDELGRLMSVTDACGAQTSWHYQGNSDRQTFVYWPDGTSDRTVRDELGRVTEEIDRLSQSTHYRYPHNGTQLPERIADVRGGESQLKWNEQGQLTEYTDCSGQQTSWRYDALGQLISRRDALGQETCYRYNDAGQIVALTLPDGSTEQFTWSDAGLLLSHQQGENMPRYWRYNARGQILSATDRLNRVIRYEYDTEGNLTGLDNDNGGAYRFIRDAEGQLREELRPDDTRYGYHFNPDGLLAGVAQQGTAGKDGKRPEKKSQLTYDAVGRLTGRQTQTERTEYQWDVMGNLLSASRTPTPQGEKLGIKPNTVTLERDAIGRVIREHNGVEALTYRYDVSGNLSTLGLPDGGEFRWLYYGSGHVTAIRYNQRLISEFERDGLHRETSRTQGALTQRRGYDQLGRRRWQGSVSSHLSEALDGPEQGALWRAYHYDDLHELAAAEDSHRGMLNYDYDAEGRLRSVYSLRGGQTNLHYDRADNLVMPAGHFAEGEPCRDNRLARWQQWRYRYDAFGNMSVRQKGALIQQYRYDADNRLVAASGDGQKGSFTAQYHYDALGRRLSKAVTTQQVRRETCFLWQGLRLLQSRSAEARQTYCYDPTEAWTPLACIEYRDGEEDLYWYHTDLNGAPQEVTDEQGEVVWSGKYDVFGEVTRQTDAVWSDLSKPLRYFWQPLRYAGQYVDEESGLHYNTFRYYAPESGRFITPDPIGLAGGLNLYQYAVNPLGWIDPLGLEVINLRHYTSNKGLEGIKESMTIKASDQNAVFATKAKGKPFSPANAADNFKIKQHHARNYIDFEIDTKKYNVEFRKNNLGVEEYKIKGDVQLDKKLPNFSKGVEYMKKKDGLSIDELKEIFSSVEEIIVATDKVMSGFDDHKRMALALLLFFSESNILDRVSNVRRIINSELESNLSETEYDEWAGKEEKYWIPPYDKTEEDLLKMQDKNLIWNKYP